MILRIVLGVLFLAMAAGQLASLGALGDIVGAYGLTDGAVSVALAVALVTGEVAAGANCGSFGTYLPQLLRNEVPPAHGGPPCSSEAENLGEELRAWGRVLVEDGLLLLYAWLLLRGTSRSRARTTAGRAGPIPGAPDISSASARNVHRKQDAS